MTGVVTTSWATSEAVRRSMTANRPRNTRLEVEFRSALHAAGLRFRKHLRPLAALRCEPDIVFTRVRLAVFMDGCWWHSCPEHGQVPKANRAWWTDKLDATRSRDARNDELLRAAGWSVLRIWEHEPMQHAVERVVDEVSRLRAEASAWDRRHG
jgi:DNA mismatch endonuclease, patch repair protein